MYFIVSINCIAKQNKKNQIWLINWCMNPPMYDRCCGSTPAPSLTPGGGEANLRCLCRRPDGWTWWCPTVRPRWRPRRVRAAAATAGCVAPSHRQTGQQRCPPSPPPSRWGWGRWGRWRGCGGSRGGGWAMGATWRGRAPRSRCGGTTRRRRLSKDSRACGTRGATWWSTSESQRHLVINGWLTCLYNRQRHLVINVWLSATWWSTRDSQRHLVINGCLTAPPGNQHVTRSATWWSTGDSQRHLVINMWLTASPGDQRATRRLVEHTAPPGDQRLTHMPVLVNYPLFTWAQQSSSCFCLERWTERRRRSASLRRCRRRWRRRRRNGCRTPCRPGRPTGRHS